jgi:hypothetical protein
MSNKRELDWSDDERSTSHSMKRCAVVRKAAASPEFSGIGAATMRDIARLGRPAMTSAAADEPHFVDYDFEPRPHPQEHAESSAPPASAEECDRECNEDLLVVRTHAYT